ncbi:ASCH domain-containing protein [Salinicola tamaricis]|uniref:ASCH domain-containing protein n=1 Tax=Salinicola tamaricis TaxID=1771309 RepID=UPI00101AD0F6|nr:ASCH domain-containing protein [Salinicola tamaricis]
MAKGMAARQYDETLDMTPQQQAFVERFLATLEEEERHRASAIQVDFFCDNQTDTNDCARLVDQGIKRASCDLLAAYEIEGRDKPAPGAFTLVVDWAQNPVCVIVTTQVEIAAFDQVSAEFAYRRARVTARSRSGGRSTAAISSARRANSVSPSARRSAAVGAVRESLSALTFRPARPLWVATLYR